MSVTFVDPRAATETPVEPYDLAVDLGGPITVGLLANGFPDSEAFLHQVEAALATALPEAGFRHWNKRNASAVASDDLLVEITSSCDAVVAAYGH